MIKKPLLIAANNKRLERTVSTNRLTKDLVRRFVAGTTLQDAISVTKELNAQGIDVSLDLLGETVEHLRESEAATDAYIEAIQAIAEHVPGASVSIKLSQLGIALDPQVCAGHLNSLLKEGWRLMWWSKSIWSTAPSAPPSWAKLFGPNLRVPAHQACHPGRDATDPLDLESFTDTKPRIRLVKGAFLETQDKALLDKDEITAQYLYLTEYALANLPDPAFGTHDDTCIAHVKKTAAELGVDRADYEFQMLYGVRRDVQRALADDGHRIRIYAVPYGTQWYPYLMRRMAERPANSCFSLRSPAHG